MKDNLKGVQVANINGFGFVFLLCAQSKIILTFQFLDGSDEVQDFMTQGRLTSEEAGPQMTERRVSQLEEELRQTQEKLRLKEKEVKGEIIGTKCITLLIMFHFCLILSYKFLTESNIQIGFSLGERIRISTKLLCKKCIVRTHQSKHRILKI